MKKAILVVFATLFGIYIGCSNNSSSPTNSSPSTGTITGKVTDTITGLPISGAYVLYSPPDTTKAKLTFSDANGNYTFTNVPAVNVTMMASDTVYALDSTTITVPANGTATQNFGLMPNLTEIPAMQTNLSGATSMLSLNGKLFASTTNGIFVSSDNGIHWSSSGSGLTSTNVVMLASNGNTLFAAISDGAGVFQSTDNGNHWTLTSFSGGGIWCLYSFNNILFVGTWGSGIFTSSDNGNTWSNVSNGLNSNAIFSFTKLNGMLYAAAQVGLYRSSDNGAHWTEINNGNFLNTKVAMLAVCGNVLFATANNEIYKSSDNGNTWSTTGPSYTAWSFAVIGNNIFAGTGAGCYYSSDEGNTWSALNMGMNGGIYPLTIYNGYLFASTNTGIVRLPL